MREVILYDKYLSGHHLSYLRIYASAFFSLGCKVTILTSDVDKVEAYLAKTLSFSSSFGVKPIKSRKVGSFEVDNTITGLCKDLLNSYSALRNFLEVKASIRSNGLSEDSLVFIMWFDVFVSKYLLPFILGLFFPYSFGGLWFHPCHIKHHADRRRRHRDLHYLAPVLRSKRLKFLGLFDDLIVSRLRQRTGRGEFYKLPDIAEKHPPDFDSEIIREIQTRAEGKKIVSMLGSLDKRKNLVTFIDAASRCNEEVFFVCAGKVHKESFSKEDLDFVYSRAGEYSSKIYLHDEHIESDRVFDTLIHISDVVVAVYTNFTVSSNMITKAALYEKRIIVADEYLMRETVEQYGLGLCVESGDVAALLAAIHEILYDGADIVCRFAEFAADHSSENLEKCLGVLISRPVS